MRNITEAFKNKILVITGGTGSFASTRLKRTRLPIDNTDIFTLDTYIFWLCNPAFMAE